MKIFDYKDVSIDNVPRDGDVIITGTKQRLRVNYSITYDEYSLSYSDNSTLTHFTDLKTFLMQINKLYLI